MMDGYKLTLDNMKNKVYTISNEGTVNSREEQRHIQLAEDKLNLIFEDEWLELVTNDTAKFEAFLREVVDGRGMHNAVEYHWVNELLEVDVSNHVEVDVSNHERAEDLIEKLVEFYAAFKPSEKKEKKKLTMAELREIVGEDFEIVE